MGSNRLPAPVQRQIGSRINQCRTQRNLTQEQLAAQTGCTPGYISELERGLKTPSLEFIYRLAGTLGIKVSELLRGTDGLPESEERREKLLRKILFQLESLIVSVRQALKD